MTCGTLLPTLMRKTGAGNESPDATGLARRKWLASLVIGGSLSLVGGAVALVRTSGYAIDDATRARLRALVPWQFAVVRAAADRILAPDRSHGVPTAQELGVAEFIDGYLVEMSSGKRDDFFRFLRVLEQLAPLASGFLPRFTELSTADQDRVLSALESSKVDRLRAGFEAMKSLAMMGYYRDPRSFAILGYRGPLLQMPEDGAP